jgi:membrane protease YdiL (CAAX protease family)
VADETATAPGVRDALLTWLAAFVASNLVGAAVLLAAGYGAADDPDPPLWLTAVLQVPFWVVLVGGTVLCSRRKGTGDLTVDMGLRAEPRDALVGLPLGALTQLVLVPLLYVPIFWFSDVDPDELSDAARELTDRANGAGVVVLVLLVVIGAPIVEELFFRGFVMGAIDRALGTGWGLWLSALFFGATHFQLLQLPALVLFGLVAGVLVHRYGRLGPAIFAHMAFNAVTIVILLLQD